jgi:hypothetical protein
MDTFGIILILTTSALVLVWSIGYLEELLGTTSIVFRLFLGIVLAFGTSMCVGHVWTFSKRLSRMYAPFFGFSMPGKAIMLVCYMAVFLAGLGYVTLRIRRKQRSRDTS